MNSLHEVKYQLSTVDIDIYIYTYISSGKRDRWEILRLSGKTLQNCTFLEEKNTFTNKEGSDTYKIREGLHLRECSLFNYL